MDNMWICECVVPTLYTEPSRLTDGEYNWGHSSAAGAGAGTGTGTGTDTGTGTGTVTVTATATATATGTATGTDWQGTARDLLLTTQSQLLNGTKQVWIAVTDRPH